MFVGAGAFYMATAIPMSWVFYLLPALMREVGHSAQTVSLLSLVYLPYALRILWAPAVDRFASGDPGRFRLVMAGSVVLSVVAILAFALVEPARDVAAIMALATGLFILLATGATALDGYTITSLDAHGRNRASIWQTVGFTTGGITLGLGALFTEGLSWTLFTVLIAAATVLSALPILRMPRRADAAQRPHLAGGAMERGGLRDLFRRPEARRLILLSIFTKAGLGMVAGYLPILQVDSGVTANMVGFFGAIGGNILGLGAAFASGALLLRFGGWRTLGWTCLVAAALFALAALVHDLLGGPVFAVTISFLFLSLGYACIAPFKALSLAVSDGRLAASKAALLASIDLTLSILAAALSGLLVTQFGLGAFFWLSMALCAAAGLLALRSDPARAPAVHPHPEQKVS